MKFCLIFGYEIFQVLLIFANPRLKFDLFEALTSLGNPYAWKLVLGFYAWALFSTLLPGTKVYFGPASPHGYVPRYAANGFQYYWATILTFFTIFYFYPTICLDIFDNFPEIVQVFNITALVFCVYLLIKGKFSPETGLDPEQNFEGKPLAYIFYRGVELHPRLFDADIKQVAMYIFEPAARFGPKARTEQRSEL